MKNSVAIPRYFPGLVDPRGEQYRRYFSYESDSGLVTGTVTHVSFHLPQSAEQIWPVFKDLNQWQNSRDHYYSKVIGDVEGETFRLTVGRPTGSTPALRADYVVNRVIAPHSIVFSQLVAETGPIAGMGGYSLFLLTPRSDGTHVSIMMQHDRTTPRFPESEALEYWRSSAPENLTKWGEFFIPTLRQRVAAAPLSH